MVVSNSVDSVDRVLPSDSADRSSVYREVKLPHSGNTSVPVVGDVVMKKHVFKPRRVGFDDQVVRHSYDAGSVVSVNAGGHTSLSAGVDMNNTVLPPVVHKRIAFVSGDVRVTDGIVPNHASGDTFVPVPVHKGDAVGVNMGGGVAMPVDVDGCSVVPPVVDSLCDVDQVLSTDTTPSGGVEEAVQYNRVVRQMARYGDSTSTFGVHCPVVLNSCAVVALVDTGANVTCVLASFVSALGATLIRKEGKLQDYKGRLDDRIGVVRLRVKKQSHVVDWDCEVVESLAGGESFVIGTDLAPQLGIWLEGVETNLASSPSRYSLPADDTDGGQRLLRGVARFSAEEETDLGDLHDVPDELADFATQDWRKEDRVPEADLRRLESLVSTAVADNKMLLQTDFCIHPRQ